MIKANWDNVCAKPEAFEQKMMTSCSYLNTIESLVPSSIGTKQSKWENQETNSVTDTWDLGRESNRGMECRETARSEHDWEAKPTGLTNKVDVVIHARRLSWSLKSGRGKGDA